MAATDRRSPVNVMRLTMWKLTSDSSSSTAYDTEAREFTNSLNSVKYSPSMQTAEQYGDGIKVEDYVAKDGGDIEVVIRAFTTGDGEFLFGETETADGVSVSSQNDIVPYVCAAYATKRADGTYNLYKFPKVKFLPEGEDDKQQEGTNISFSTATLKGTYSPLLSTGNDCYKCYGVDPDTEAAFIESWFGSADFYTDGAAE